MINGWAVLIIATWLTGAPDSQQIVTVEVRSMQLCEGMARQAREQMDRRGRYVEVYCLEAKP